MPKRKAESWPASIHQDDDVLSLDEDGRFVLCRVCHVHYAVHGGKKPKPVIMNSSFRTRAWEVHKERTNSHRMQRSALLHDPVAAAAVVASSAGTASLAPLLSPIVDGNHTTPPSSIQRPAVPPPPSADLSSAVPPTNAQELSSRSSPSSSAVGNAGRATPAMEPNTRPISPQQTSTGPSRYIDMRSSMTSSTGAHSCMDHRSSTSSGQRSASRSSDALSAAESKKNRSEQNDHRIRRLPAPDASSSSASRSAVNPLRTERRTGSVTSRDAGPATQTQDLAGNNERVAQTLKILDDEYNANAFIRRSMSAAPETDSRQYWKNLRSVYSKSSSKKQRRSHRSSDGVTTSSTPDDSGSSQNSTTRPRPPPCADVCRHHELANSIARFTAQLAKHFTERENSTGNSRAIREVTQVLRDMRADNQQAFSRLILLQEQSLDVLESILRHSDDA